MFAVTISDTRPKCLKCPYFLSSLWTWGGRFFRERLDHAITQLSHASVLWLWCRDGDGGKGSLCFPVNLSAWAVTFRSLYSVVNFSP
jgi:hypothetical protein